jgi:hypothetical protein
LAPKKTKTVTQKNVMTYSSTLAMGRQQSLARGNNATGLARGGNSVSFKITDKRLGPVSNTIVLIVLACLLGLLYLTQVTKTNAYGYQINGLQHQQSKLQQQHEDLAVASARLQSMDRVSSSQPAADMSQATPSGSVQ